MLLWGLILAAGNPSEGNAFQEVTEAPQKEEISRFGPFARVCASNVEGSFFSEEGPVQGTRLSLEDDLGFENRTGAWETGMGLSFWWGRRSRLGIGHGVFLDARGRKKGRTDE